jgi:hypothetical protein
LTYTERDLDGRTWQEIDALVSRIGAEIRYLEAEAGRLKRLQDMAAERGYRLRMEQRPGSHMEILRRNSETLREAGLGPGGARATGFMVNSMRRDIDGVMRLVREGRNGG